MTLRLIFFVGLISAFSRSYAGTIILPIEVFPLLEEQFSRDLPVSEKYSNQIIVNLTGAPADVANIYLKTHRAAYYRSNGVKASVQINNGPWLDLTNSNVNLYSQDSAYGGLGGGFRANQFLIPISRLGGVTGLRSTNNVVRFRFNGSDGATSGYRVLKIGFLTASGANRIADSFENDNPNNWTVPDTSLIAAGKQYYTQLDLLKEYPTGRRIKASCASCHAARGDDLEYYAYSNRSIISRSIFHGLSRAQGRAIASYIRSLNGQVERLGRPWDPPYQPGPVVDSRPVKYWAAGAGLESVLTSDLAMRNYLFKYGTDSRANVLRAVNSSEADAQTLNMRSLPIAIQLPDWNDWLPQVHPLDIWSSGLNFSRSLNPGYVSVVNNIASGRSRIIHRSDNASVIHQLNRLQNETRNFLEEGSTEPSGSQWRITRSTNLDSRNSVYSLEMAKHSLATWIAVKTWEIMHEFNLENKAKIIFGADGEVFQWPLTTQSVHQLAPHIIANNILNFSSGDLSQTPVKGVYDSTAWYQLQIVLNSGARVADGVQPVDWPYQYGHIQKLGRYSNIYEPYRYASSYIKALQMRNNTVGISRNGWALRYVSPYWLVRAGATDSEGRTLLRMDSRTRRLFLEASLLHFLSVSDGQYRLADWDQARLPETDGPATLRWYRIDAQSFIPFNFVRGQLSCNGYYEDTEFSISTPCYSHANDFYRLIKNHFNSGDYIVGTDVLDRFISFNRKLWPYGSWSP